MTTRALEKTANQIRQDIIKMLVEAGSGHSAGPLGMADVFTALYFGNVVKHVPNNPDAEDRDRVILSNGHICPVWYATLAQADYFPREELMTLRKINSRLQGHPHRGDPPGVENTGGPLGQGLSQACGIAWAFLQAGKTSEVKGSQTSEVKEASLKQQRVWCLMSDAEHQEGQTWEAIMFAGNKKLHNLTALIDRNNIQIDGFTEEVMPIEPLREKYEAFNWHVQEVDGHNIEAIIAACHEAKAVYEKPSVIICHTIPGKGVSFMEQDYKWHGIPPKPEEAKKALVELRTLGGKIRSEHE